MSALVSAFILTIVIMAGQQVTATQSCQYSYSCTGGGVCTYLTRTCDDICCDDKTKGYNDICCSSSSNTVTIAASASGGTVAFIIIICLCWCCCSSGNRVHSIHI